MIVAMTWTRAAQIAGRGARLGLVAVVLLGLWRGAATPVILAAFFLAISLLVERIAPSVLDACFGVVLLAHASGVLLGGPADSGVWGPAMHLAAPFLVALILAVAAADGRLLAPAASLRVALGTGLLGGLLVIVAWEILELALNRISGVHIHTERGDTVTDLALGTLATGAGVALAAAILAHRRHGPVAVTDGGGGPAT